MTSLFSQWHVKYLGLPLVSGKLSLKYFKPLQDKVEARISSGTVRKLTFARRLQLQSILCNIQSFWSCQSLLPNKSKSRSKKIQPVCMAWTENRHKNILHLLMWQIINGK